MPAATVIGSSNTALPSTASSTVAKPASVVSGSFLLCFHGASTSTVAAMAITGGGTWNSTEALSLGTNVLSCRISWRFAGGAEPATYGITQSTASSNGVVTLVVMSDVDPAIVNPVYGAVASATTAATTITCPDATPAGTNDVRLRLALGVGGASCTWSFAAESPVATGLGDIQVNTLRANQEVTWAQLTSNAAVGTNLATSTFSQSNRIAHTVLIPSAPSAGGGIPDLTMARYPVMRYR